MKTLKITSFLLFLFLVANNSFGQNGKYDIRLTNAIDNCSGSKYYVDIEVKANNATSTFNIADQNYRLSFNRNALDNPFVAQELELSGFTSKNGLIGFFAPHHLNGSIDTVLSYNVGFTGGNGYPVNSTEWIPVGRIGFDRISTMDPGFIIHDDQPINFPPTFISEKNGITLTKAQVGVLTSTAALYGLDAGQDVTLTGTGVQIGSEANDPFTSYQWSPKIGLSDTTSGNTIANPTVTTTYTLCGTNFGCTTCDNVTVVVSGTPTSNVVIDLKVWLEGPYDAGTNKMTTYLNKKAGSQLHRGLLPGQTPINTQVLVPTPAGQPYNIPPYNYAGSEGAGWSDTDYEQIKQTYGLDVVDWILVSFRSGIPLSTELTKAAAVLLEDGSIVFLNPITTAELGMSAGITDVYIVIQHRNHLVTMTPAPVSLVNNTLTWDFTSQDSYALNSIGQHQLSNGEWVILAGEMYSEPGGTFSDDINGADGIIFYDNNGTFDNYNRADLDLNADVNGTDALLFRKNTGSASAVPR